jgi:hypothetical protein
MKNGVFTAKKAIAKCCISAGIQTSQKRIPAVALAERSKKVFTSEFFGTD